MTPVKVSKLSRKPMFSNISRQTLESANPQTKGEKSTCYSFAILYGALDTNSSSLNAHSFSRLTGWRTTYCSVCFQRKQLGIKSSPLSEEHSSRQYTISVFSFTLRIHLLAGAENNSYLSIYSFLFFLCCI